MATTTIINHPVRGGFHDYPQQYTMYQARAQHHPQFPLHHSITIDPYAHYATVSQQQQQQHHSQPSSHHYSAPLSSLSSSNSPISEDGSKLSLPSISNLLGIAGRQTSTDHVTPPPCQVPSQQPQDAAHLAQLPSPDMTHTRCFDARSRGPYSATELSTSPSSVGLPSAQSHAASLVDSTHSPSVHSPASNITRTPYFPHAAPHPLDSADQCAIQAQMAKQRPLPSQPDTSPYETSRYATSYTTSPSADSASSFFSPTESNGSIPCGLYQQRPLPSFPLSAPMPVQPTSQLSTLNPWEHHHYISPSSQATYPQSQDRYICLTCNKAFSRPSSLKIHSHSHTGEKPFRCPHAGCGKAFSVRSNMKRHERGCHSGTSNESMPHFSPHLRDIS